LIGRPAVVPGSVGVFGGTFDPIHIVHLAVAEEAAEVLGLERVIFVPAGLPPHKPGRLISPGEQRLAMVELAIAGNDRFEASRIELDRPGPSFMVDTLAAMLTAAPGAGRVTELTLILSAEAFAGVASWREPGRIIELARIAVAPRDGYPDPDPQRLEAELPGLTARTMFLDAPRLRLSSTDLRERAAAGRSLRYLVPDAVAAYIGDHGLYADPRRSSRS
jgi:nicotinate-nucleotide adenylyltransferase